MLKGLEKKCYRWFWFFLIFSSIGWIYEVAIMYFEMHMGFINRGFLYGPYLPIYGFGGLMILLCMAPIRKKELRLGRLDLTPVLCFVMISLLATIVELAASYLMEWKLGYFLWNYHGLGYGPDFQGRIALRSSLQFGLMGMVILYGASPLLDKCTHLWQKKAPVLYRLGTLLIMTVFLADVVYHLIHGSNLNW